MVHSLKIVLISPEGIHIDRWSGYLNRLGYDVSLIKRKSSDKNPHGIREYYLPEPCPDFSEKELEEELNVIHDLPTQLFKNKIGFARRLKTYRDIIKQINPDVVHGHWIYEYGLFGMLSARFLKPYVQTVWGSDIFLCPMHSEKCATETIYVLQNSDYILGNSKTLINTAMSFIGWINKPNSVFKWGVPDYFKKNLYDKINLRKDYGFKQDDIVILSARGFKTVYNLRTILAAFDIVKKEYGNVRLILAGQGYGWETEKTFGISDKNIRIVNYTSHNEIAKLMALSDISISIPFSDSMANTLVESMMMGLYTIASNLYSVKDYFKDNIHLKLVNPANLAEITDAVREYIQKPILAEEFRRNAMPIIESEFNEDKAVKDIERVYSRVLQNFRK